MSYENSAGLSVRNHYGPKLISESEQFGGQDTTSGLHKRAVWTFDYDNLPVNSTDEGEMEFTIPAYAHIMSTQIEVIEAMEGTLGVMSLGLVESDGTDIDMYGLGGGLEQADLGSQVVLDCTGHLVGASLLNTPAQLYVATSGTVTGGRFRVVIEYRQTNQDATGTYVAGGVKGN
ncbi:MAG: hypothetical protein GY746_16175 [Gammaproteobacteria bacterium]|nr:hypothetical protein [Gammaproteobacteria bacterium]